MSSAVQRMVYHLQKARAKIHYVDQHTVDLSPRMEKALMAARREIDSALDEARRAGSDRDTKRPRRRKVVRRRRASR